MPLNWFVVKEIIERADDSLTSSQIWERAKDEKPHIKYSTVKEMLKKLAESRSTDIVRESVDGRGRGGQKYVYRERQAVAT